MNTVSEETYNYEYKLRKEAEFELFKLERKLNEIEAIFDEMKKEISEYKTGELKDLERDETIDIVLEIIEGYKIKIT